MLYRHSNRLEEQAVTTTLSTIRTATCAAALLLIATVARAQTSALTVHNDVTPPESVLQSLDLTTGDLAPIGVLGPTDPVWDLALLPSGELVGVDRDCGLFVGIDPLTGDAAVVGDLGIDHPEPIFVSDLAADACGRLWMICATVGAPPERDYFLYRIDTATGAAEPYGLLPEQVPGLAAAGEMLYGFDAAFGNVHRILTLDPVTMTVTEIAEVDDLLGWASAAIDFDDQGDLVSLGEFFSPTPPPGPQAIVRIRLSGEVTSSPVSLGPAMRVNGLAVTPPAGECLAPLAIPTASAGGLAALVILLGAAGSILVLRRS